MKMDTAFFRSFFLNNDGLSSPLQATPATFDDSSPVVVVDLNHREAGELLGVSKSQRRQQDGDDVSCRDVCCLSSPGRKMHSMANRLKGESFVTIVTAMLDSI